MAELKTKKTAESVAGFLKKIADPGVRKDSATLIAIMKAASKAEPKMWGTAIIGFGDLRYKYASGREGDWFLTGFAPRKDKLTLYLMISLEPLAPLLKKLGPHKPSGSCLHLRHLDDVDLPTLRKIVAKALVLCKKRFKVLAGAGKQARSYATAFARNPLLPAYRAITLRPGSRIYVTDPAPRPVRIDWSVP